MELSKHIDIFSGSWTGSGLLTKVSNRVPESTMTNITVQIKMLVINSYEVEINFGSEYQTISYGFQQNNSLITYLNGTKSGVGVVQILYSDKKLLLSFTKSYGDKCMIGNFILTLSKDKTKTDKKEDKYKTDKQEKPNKSNKSNNPTKPTITEKEKKPANPTNPTNPTKPTNPTNPTRTEKEEKPAKSTKPIKLVEISDSTDNKLKKSKY